MTREQMMNLAIDAEVNKILADSRLPNMIPTHLMTTEEVYAELMKPQLTIEADVVMETKQLK